MFNRWQLCALSQWTWSTASWWPVSLSAASSSSSSSPSSARGSSSRTIQASLRAQKQPSLITTTGWTFRNESSNFVLRTVRRLDDLWIKKKLWHFMLSIRLWDLDLRPPHNSDKPGFSRYPDLLSSLHPEVYHSLSYKRVSVSVFLIYECYFNLKYLLNVELHPTVPYCSCT